jgi:hypothetical protein
MQRDQDTEKRPASESAASAGVGTLVISTRPTLLIETWLKKELREVPLAPEMLAICAPSVEMVTKLLAKPRRFSRAIVVLFFMLLGVLRFHERFTTP